MEADEIDLTGPLKSQSRDDTHWMNLAGWQRLEFARKGGRSAATEYPPKRRRGTAEGKPTDEKAGECVGEMYARANRTRTLAYEWEGLPGCPLCKIKSATAEGLVFCWRETVGATQKIYVCEPCVGGLLSIMPTDSPRFEKPPDTACETRGRIIQRWTTSPQTMVNSATLLMYFHLPLLSIKLEKVYIPWLRIKQE